MCNCGSLALWLSSQRLSGLQYELPEMGYVHVLGYAMSAHCMIVAWSRRKCLALQLELATLLSACCPINTPCMAASLLGKILSVSQISPWGIYASLTLWSSLTHAVRASQGGSRRGSRWAKGCIHVPTMMEIIDLSILLPHLDEVMNSLLSGTGVS
jgi:hypothetical protein